MSQEFPVRRLRIMILLAMALAVLVLPAGFATAQDKPLPSSLAAAKI